MNRQNDNNRPLWFILLFLLSLAFFSNVSGALLIVFLLMAAFWALRNVDLNNFNRNLDMFRNNNSSQDYYEDEYEDEYYAEEDEPDTRNVQREPVYRHALTAVEAAGLNPDTTPVLAVDMGVLAYRGSENPSIYRTWTVPEDADYLQPFVQLRLNTKATGRIRFEVVDSRGKTVFAHEAVQSLEKGRNFISPPSRLPLSEQINMDGRWQLKVSADSVLLAVHRFEFAEATTASIRRHLAEDGEINTDSRLVMDENPLPKMSLDDLLAYQDDEEQQRRAK
jgi:hypothetical protein